MVPSLKAHFVFVPYSCTPTHSLFFLRSSSVPVESRSRRSVRMPRPRPRLPPPPPRQGNPLSPRRESQTEVTFCSFKTPYIFFNAHFISMLHFDHGNHESCLLLLGTAKMQQTKTKNAKDKRGLRSIRQAIASVSREASTILDRRYGFNFPEKIR